MRQRRGCVIYLKILVIVAAIVATELKLVANASIFVQSVPPVFGLLGTIIWQPGSIGVFRFAFATDPFI